MQATDCAGQAHYSAAQKDEKTCNKLAVHKRRVDSPNTSKHFDERKHKQEFHYKRQIQQLRQQQQQWRPSRQNGRAQREKQRANQSLDASISPIQPPSPTGSSGSSSSGSEASSPDPRAPRHHLSHRAHRGNMEEVLPIPLIVVTPPPPEHHACAEPPSLSVDIRCPEGVTAPDCSAYIRILKSRFDFDDCALCESYAVSLVLRPDEAVLHERCTRCASLYRHYTMTFYPLSTDSADGSPVDPNARATSATTNSSSTTPTASDPNPNPNPSASASAKSRFVLPQAAADRMALMIINDQMEDVRNEYAQVFLEGPDNQMIVRTFSRNNRV